MNITYIYESNDKKLDREYLVKRVVEYISTLIELPNDIQVVFAILDDSIYGSTFVNPRFKNRITVNNKLTNTELPYVLIHELIHINQIHTGRLSVASNGMYIWGGSVYSINKNTDYDDLPWEQDVAAREQQIKTKVLHFLNN